jgi:hypothetical protein
MVDRGMKERTIRVERYAFLVAVQRFELGACLEEL